MQQTMMPKAWNNVPKMTWNDPQGRPVALQTDPFEVQRHIKKHDWEKYDFWLLLGRQKEKFKYIHIYTLHMFIYTGFYNMSHRNSQKTIDNATPTQNTELHFQFAVAVLGAKIYIPKKKTFISIGVFSSLLWPAFGGPEFLVYIMFESG